jgi:hypothetical protein
MAHGGAIDASLGALFVINRKQFSLPMAARLPRTMAR